MRRIRRLPLLLIAGAVLVSMLSGCVAIKPGSYSLKQPGGIGPVKLQFTACTLLFPEPKEPEELVPPECGPSAEAVKGQMLLGLIVPSGTISPETIAATPGPGAAATSFSRNAELAAQLGKKELFTGVVGAPPGFEIAGYSSGAVSETAGKELTWVIGTELGLPPGAGGGSYGGPLKATAILGWRNVTPALPTSRPINCEEEAPGETFCGAASSSGEATLGVSDLKVSGPASTAVVPGASVKIPFVLDFASSAAELPKFKLAVASKLPGAELSLSNTSFSRAPTEAGTNRAPPTTRQALVHVPLTAKLGSYELGFTATANAGGVATAASTLVVKPKGSAKATVAKRVKATLASGRGVPVKLFAPIAGTRFLVVIKGPNSKGRGKVRIAKKTSTAKALGTTILRLRIPGAKAAAFLADGASLRLEAKVRQPGTKKPKLLKQTFSLR